MTFVIHYISLSFKS